ncbi:MAG: hypothetical protein HOV80_18810 [Polyangiaceae bacterium]|nr:hypothetical protein [Polyangiaceae bacterium]
MTKLSLLIALGLAASACTDDWDALLQGDGGAGAGTGAGSTGTETTTSTMTTSTSTMGSTTATSTVASTGAGACPEPSMCGPGTITPNADASIPPCGDGAGCSTCLGSGGDKICTWGCNLCGAACSDYTCPTSSGTNCSGPVCDTCRTSCTLGTSCNVTCNSPEGCDLKCAGCTGGLSCGGGSGTCAVGCTDGARCNVSSARTGNVVFDQAGGSVDITGGSGTTSVIARNSSSLDATITLAGANASLSIESDSVLAGQIAAQDVTVTCSGGATCDVGCSPTGTCNLSCDDTSTCLFQCDDSVGGMCPDPACTTLVSCGNNSWACNRDCDDTPMTCMP